MATQVLKQIRPWTPSIATDPVILGGLEMPYFKEAATQSWKVGSLVYGDADGNVAICTNTSQAMTSPILGQALTAGRSLAAAGAATNPIAGNFQVRVIRPSDIFIAQAYHTTPASAVTVATDMWDVKGLYLVAATGLWHLDYVNAVEGSANSLARVQIVGFPDQVDGTVNTIGDVYGFALVRFLTHSWDSADSVPLQRILQWAS